MLARVHIPAPEQRFDDYPHKLSGGMRQRVMIAMALACKPKLLIADEPTTALDVTIQAQILDLMRTLREQTGTAIILITHDLGVVAELADDVAVMYAGRVVERAKVADLFAQPQHPYTIGLLGSIPRLDVEQDRLAAIEGQVPNPLAPVGGCRFHPRCPFAVERCRSEEPPIADVGGGHLAACWRVPLAADASCRRVKSSTATALLRVDNLVKHFPVQQGLFARQSGAVRAVDGVSFELAVGETLALVGESGCGKSTTGRLLLRLLEPTSGTVHFDGVDLFALDAEAMRGQRRALQIIFQDPYASLNPRMTVGQTLTEPLALHGARRRTARASVLPNCCSWSVSRRNTPRAIRTNFRAASASASASPARSPSSLG